MLTNIYNKIRFIYKLSNLKFKCLICLEECYIYNSYNTSCCYYILYHKECLKNWFIYNKTCPICHNIIRCN